jgi:Tat protein translocase TatB subunit
MFGSIGATELLIIAGVALVVMGPERFPEFAKIVMRTIREIRGYWDDAKRDISKELRPVESEIRQLKQYNPEDYIDALTDSDSDSESEDTYGDYDDTYGYGQEEYGDGDFQGRTPEDESDTPTESEAGQVDQAEETKDNGAAGEEPGSEEQGFTPERLDG